MKNLNQLSIGFRRIRFSNGSLIGAVVALVFLVVLFTGSAIAQTGTTGSGSFLSPWFGVWSITDEGASAGTASNQKNTVEIRPTADHRGLEITRKNPTQPDVSEVLIPDGTRRPLNPQNCTGWQTCKWVPEAGSILESSEVTCKDSGTLETSTLKTFVAPDQMIEVLSVKAASRTGVAVRHLRYEHDLAPAPDSQAAWVGAEGRIPLSAPWTMDAIIQLSRSVDTQAMEAALMEKKVRLNLTSGSLKQMQAAKLPKEIIDLTVALSFPDRFHIEKNGQVALKPLIVSSTSGSAPRNSYQGVLSYYPGAFYDCYSPLGYYYGFPYSGLLGPGSCWSYYSPFWWDYPIYLNGEGGAVIGGGGGSGGGSTGVVSSKAVATTGGYVQIQPVSPPRHAIPRQGWGSTHAPSPQGQPGSSGAYSSAPAYSGSSGASSGGGSGASSSGGGGASAPSASPGGYSSGGSGGGGTAVPR